MEILTEARRIVIKIGHSQLIDAVTGKVKKSWLTHLMNDVAELKKSGKEVIIVSSGAIAIGSSILKIHPNKMDLVNKQAASCVGQIELINFFREALLPHKINCAQALMTLEDFENRKHFSTMKSVVEALLREKVIPIINENDLVATAEIRFGDNDRLAGRVTQMMEADCLLLLANIDGLYTEDPNINPQAQFISEIYEIGADLETIAADSLLKTGGMSAKLAAAKIAMKSNCNVIITSGRAERPIEALMNNLQKASLFLPLVESKMKYKKES